MFSQMQAVVEEAELRGLRPEQASEPTSMYPQAYSATDDGGASIHSDTSSTLWQPWIEADAATRLQALSRGAATRRVLLLDELDQTDTDTMPAAAAAAAAAAATDDGDDD